MKKSVLVGCLLGLSVLLAIVVHADFAGILQVLRSGGPMLWWLMPYRVSFYTLYAAGWLALLRPVDEQHRATLGYLLWAAIVRDGVDRLLPVASVGGSVVGVRLLRWRGIATAPGAASVIVEIMLTLVVVYLFTALGLLLLSELSGTNHEYRRALVAFLISLPAPVCVLLLLRKGWALRLLHSLIGSIAGEGELARETAALDREVRASLRRPSSLVIAGTLQLVAFLSGAFEIWFPLRLFNHPVSPAAALALESMTQAVRHIAFLVPAGIGVQEAGLVVFGQALGISADMAFALAMVKRLREIAWGLPALASWQWAELRRLRRAVAG
jgi:putative membrane protein